MNNPESSARNLVLVGFMGSGKSHVGQRVAKSLGFAFADTDDLIEEAAGKSIPKIFAEDGEDAFRERETAALEQAARGESQVLATGGGIVTRERNRKILRRAGYVIWLVASRETVYERVRRNRNRPLLANDDPEETIRVLLEEREPLYREVADLEIDTDDLTLDETAFGVAESARLALAIGT